MNWQRSELYWWLKRKRRGSGIPQGKHSQYGQDVFVHELLGKPANGFFIDIGASDGVTGSNSLMFEELGWEGVCVEPNPVIFEQMAPKRNCHKLNACISDVDGEVQFLAVHGEGHMLSGIYDYMGEAHLQRIKAAIEEHGSRKEMITIQSLTPKTLMQRFGFKEVDYLSVDTEGSELPILQSFDFSSIKVRAMTVENGNKSPDVFHHLGKQGFWLKKCLACDEVYLTV